MALSIIDLILFACTAVSLVGGECPPRNEESALEYKVAYSSVVVHGVVISEGPDSSVEFEARCFYKGGPLDEKIRIIRVGYNPDNCLTTNLTKGSAYVVYLKKDDKGNYFQEFQPDVAAQAILDDVISVCGVTVTYAIGMDENNNKEQCLDPSDYEDCFSVATTSTPKKSTDETNQLHQKDSPEGVQSKSEDPGMSDGNSSSAKLFLHKSAVVSILLMLIVSIIN